jgi:hypothetical protein
VGTEKFLTCVDNASANGNAIVLKVSFFKADALPCSRSTKQNEGPGLTGQGPRNNGAGFA